MLLTSQLRATVDKKLSLISMIVKVCQHQAVGRVMTLSANWTLYGNLCLQSWQKELGVLSSLGSQERRRIWLPQQSGTNKWRALNDPVSRFAPFFFFLNQMLMATLRPFVTYWQSLVCMNQAMQLRAGDLQVQSHRQEVIYPYPKCMRLFILASCIKCSLPGVLLLASNQSHLLRIVVSAKIN